MDTWTSERVAEVIARANDYNARHGIHDASGRQIVPPANPSGLTPCGWRILVRPNVVEKTTESGIVLPDMTADQEQLAQTDGIVVAIGADCFSRSDISYAWCKVGDHVMFGKYKGLIREGRDGVKYRVINDTDIVCVIDQ